MLKKLAVAGASAALLLSVAGVAFARGGDGIHNWAEVQNTVNTNSNTGNNSFTVLGNLNGYNSAVATGNAYSYSNVSNNVNGLSLDGRTEVHFNGAEVHNTVNTNSNTGYNGFVIEGSLNGQNSFVGTGNATSYSFVSNRVNTVVTHE